MPDAVTLTIDGRSVTVPDGTVFNPGDTFTKTWRLENTGSCAWTTGTALVFTSGDLMGAPTEVDAINGAIVRLGEEHGIPTPMNRAIWKMVRESH